MRKRPNLPRFWKLLICATCRGSTTSSGDIYCSENELDTEMTNRWEKWMTTLALVSVPMWYENHVGDKEHQRGKEEKKERNDPSICTCKMPYTRRNAIFALKFILVVQPANFMTASVNIYRQAEIRVYSNVRDFKLYLKTFLHCEFWAKVKARFAAESQKPWQ